jgi:hypothetical protein
VVVTLSQVASPASAGVRAPLLVVNVSKVSDDEQLMLAALQGLVNRRSGRVYLVGLRNGHEFEVDQTAKTWLRDAVPRRVSKRAKRIRPYRLLKRFRSRLRGLVVWDPALAVDTQNVATTMAGLKRLLPVSPKLVPRLRKPPFRLPVVADLRKEGLESRQEAYEWAFEKLGPPSRFGLLAWLGGPRNGRPGQHGLRDLIVARRGFAFEAEPHREWELTFRILDAFPAGTPVYGYPFHDDEFYAATGLASGEPFGVGEISRSGKFLIPTGSGTNLSFHSRLRARIARPPWDDSPWVADPGDTGKTYVAFLLSDGDSLGHQQHWLRTRHWDNPARGSVPMGVSTTPWLAVDAPRIHNFYVRSMKPNEVMFAGPSGAGYIYPQLHSDLDGFLALTRRMMRRSGLHAVWILDNGYLASPTPEIVQRYVEALRPSAIFADYGGYLLPNPPPLSFSDGVPVFHAIWGWPDVASTVDRIRLAASTFPGRPAFVTVALSTATMGYSQAGDVMDRLGSSFVAVRPDRFVGLVNGTYGIGG